MSTSLDAGLKRRYTREFLVLFSFACAWATCFCCSYLRIASNAYRRTYGYIYLGIYSRYRLSSASFNVRLKHISTNAHWFVDQTVGCSSSITSHALSMPAASFEGGMVGHAAPTLGRIPP